MSIILYIFEVPQYKPQKSCPGTCRYTGQKQLFKSYSFNPVNYISN